jgi:EGF domain
MGLFNFLRAAFIGGNTPHYCDVKLAYDSILGVFCSDINECLTNDGGCSQQAFCTNTIGSFVCSCFNGFAGNGFTCNGLFSRLMMP